MCFFIFFILFFLYQTPVFFHKTLEQLPVGDNVCQITSHIVNVLTVIHICIFHLVYFVLSFM